MKDYVSVLVVDPCEWAFVNLLLTVLEKLTGWQPDNHTASNSHMPKPPCPVVPRKNDRSTRWSSVNVVYNWRTNFLIMNKVFRYGTDTQPVQSSRAVGSGFMHQLILGNTIKIQQPKAVVASHPKQNHPRHHCCLFSEIR